MAKKKKASRPKPRARKQRVKNPTLEHILSECALAVGRGVGSRGSKDIGEDASAQWLRHFAIKFKKALRRGESWKASRTNVLTVAFNMGQFASDQAAGTTITAVEAEAAARNAEHDPACPVTAPGGGRFCA